MRDDSLRLPEAHLPGNALGVAGVLVDRGVCVDDAENPPAGAVVGVWGPQSSDVWAAGARDPSGSPMTRDTVHDLASVTKLVTTCAVMALVTAGPLDLESPVSRHLPWTGPDPTLRDLLRHRAGLLPWQPLHHVARSRAEVLALLPRLPRGGGVDEAYAYSDLSFIALGAVVENATGLRLDDAVRTLVTGPLGIGLHYRPAAAVDPPTSDARTRSDVDGATAVGAGPSANTGAGGPTTGGIEAVAASALDEAWEERMIATGEPYPVHLEPDRALPPLVRRAPVRGTVHDANAFHAMGGVSGHAGLFGSVPDLLTLGRALLDTGHGLWSDAVVEEFTTPGPDPYQGLGFRLRPLGTDDAQGSAGGGDHASAGGAASRSADRAGWQRASGPERLAWHPGFTGAAVGVRLGGQPQVLAMATNRHLHDGDPVPTDRLWERVLQVALTPAGAPRQATRA